MVNKKNYKNLFYPISKLSITNKTRNFLIKRSLICEEKSKAKILLCRFNDLINEESLKPFKSLTHIGTITTGTTHIDLEYLKRSRIKLISLFSCKQKLKNIKSSSEHALLLTLCAIKRVGHYWIAPINNDLCPSTYTPIEENISHPVLEIKNYKLSILGFGRIGSFVAENLRSIGADIKYNDLDPKINLFKRVPLQGLKNSNGILISCDLNKSTKNIINNEFLNDAKITSIINIAREECVDYSALINWLRQSKYNYYYTDVQDSISTEQELYLSKAKDISNQIIQTPHVAGLSKESYEQADMIVVSELINSLD